MRGEEARNLKKSHPWNLNPRDRPVQITDEGKNITHCESSLWSNKVPHTIKLSEASQIKEVAWPSHTSPNMICLRYGIWYTNNNVLWKRSAQPSSVGWEFHWLIFCMYLTFSSIYSLLRWSLRKLAYLTSSLSFGPAGSLPVSITLKLVSETNSNISFEKDIAFFEKWFRWTLWSKHLLMKSLSDSVISRSANFVT